MQELITINNDGVAVVDSITIADGVNVQHKNVLELIRKYIPDFEAFGPIAFETRKGKALPQGGFAKATEVAWLNEDQTTLLFTFLKNTEIARKLKIRLVQAFRQCRDELAKSRAQQIPQSLPEALRLAADLAEKNQTLALKVKEDEPKISYLDRIMAANESMTITNAAKVIGYPPRKFKDYMRQIGFLYASADTPKQEHIPVCVSVVHQLNERNYRFAKKAPEVPCHVRAAPLACPCRHFRVDRRTPHVA